MHLRNAATAVSAEHSFLGHDARFGEERAEALCAAGGNVKCGSCFGREFGDPQNCYLRSRHMNPQVRGETYAREKRKSRSHKDEHGCARQPGREQARGRQR